MLEIGTEGFDGFGTGSSILLGAPLGVDAILEYHNISTKYEHNWRHLEI